MTGLRFHEAMQGRLAPQFINPSGGYRNRGAVAATLNARIDIADVGDFVRRDHPHEGTLSVEISIPILSSRPFVQHNGHFALFRASELEQGGRGYVMVYDAEVTNGERRFKMTGRKYLQPRRLWRFWRLWPETTRLHLFFEDVTPGRDDGFADRTVEIPVQRPMPDWLEKVQLPVESLVDRDFHHPRFAAGIVRISLWGFVLQVIGMRGVGSPPYRRPVAKLRFMAFFVRSLVAIYVFGRQEVPQ